MSSTNKILNRYKNAVLSENLLADSAQENAARALDIFLEQAERGEKERKKFWKKFSSSKNTTQCFYLYGGVGRGKTMLMDWFFADLEISEKERHHFHSFMQNVHNWLHNWRTQKEMPTVRDPLLIFAKEKSLSCRVLCFDELQILDIADAMLVSRLFSALFAEGILVIFTSNRVPEDLYIGGIQRESFLPFIHLLRERAIIHELNSPKDYRHHFLSALQMRYFSPLGADADKFIQESFSTLTHNHVLQGLKVKIAGRNLYFTQYANHVLATDFATLCTAALGAADYLALTEHCDVLLLSNIPMLSAENRNEAKRFVTLVDILYDKSVVLICSAAAKAEKIYVSGSGSFEFARTISRLKEMQSDAYPPN